MTATASDPALARDWLAAIAEHRDRNAFADLCRHFMPRLLPFLRARAGEECEALCQEVLLTVWRKAEQYDPAKAAPSTWVFTIARNRAIDHLRRRRPEPDPRDPHFVRGAGSDETLEPDVTASRAQQAQALRESMQQLPPEQRAVLDAVYLRAQTLRESAEQLGIPIGTAKSRVRLALATLRRHLESKGHTDV